MTTATVILAVLAAAGFPVLLWATGRAVTALAARVPADSRRPPHYLAGRLDGIQITTVIDGHDELLVTLTTTSTQATRSPLAGIFRITAHDCSLTRVKRWHHEHTTLRAHLSPDGAIMLADPALGGNAPCEPPLTITRHTHTRATAEDNPPPHGT
jgi:hypothetical protein